MLSQKLWRKKKLAEPNVISPAKKTNARAISVNPAFILSIGSESDQSKFIFAEASTITSRISSGGMELHPTGGFILASSAGTSTNGFRDDPFEVGNCF